MDELRDAEPLRADGLPVRERRVPAAEDADARVEDDAVGEPVAGEQQAAGEPSDADASTAAPAAPDADAPPADDPLARLELRLEEAQRLLARQTDHAERLHAENLRLREGELRAALLPLVRDLLRVHDDLARLTALGEGTVDDLEIARGGILDALARNGIVASAATQGEAFDPKRHRAEGRVETDDPDRHRTIAETLRGGFAWDDGSVVRPADVRVYTLARSAEPPSSATTTD